MLLSNQFKNTNEKFKYFYKYRFNKDYLKISINRKKYTFRQSKNGLKKIIKKN